MSIRVRLRLLFIDAWKSAKSGTRNLGPAHPVQIRTPSMSNCFRRRCMLVIKRRKVLPECTIANVSVFCQTTLSAPKRLQLYTWVALFFFLLLTCNKIQYCIGITGVRVHLIFVWIPYNDHKNVRKQMVFVIIPLIVSKYRILRYKMTCSHFDNKFAVALDGANISCLCRTIMGRYQLKEEFSMVYFDS